MPTMTSSHGVFLMGIARASADLVSLLPTFMVRLRTVFGVVCAESGRSSPRKSATLPNGNKAASLAVRYFNSGVVGSLLVNIAEKLFWRAPTQEHPSERRMRMPTLPYTARRVDW